MGEFWVLFFFLFFYFFKFLCHYLKVQKRVVLKVNEKKLAGLTTTSWTCFLVLNSHAFALVSGGFGVYSFSCFFYLFMFLHHYRYRIVQQSGGVSGGVSGGSIPLVVRLLISMLCVLQNKAISLTEFVLFSR